MDVHGYTESGNIDATINGVRYAGIPDDPSNRFRIMIAAWEAEGNVIPPFVALPAPIAALTRRQARMGLLSIGITVEDVEAQIATIADPMERAGALIEWRDADTYQRDHWLVSDLAASFDLPALQVDALWIWAASL